MKRIRLLVLSCVFLLGLVACGTGEDTTAPDVTTEAPETTGAPETKAPSRVEAYLEEHGWYLQEKPWALPDPIPLTDLEKAYAVKVPKTYSQRVEEFDVTVDFFREAWALGDFMQVSVAVLNHGAKTYTYHSDSYGTGFFERSDGEKKKLLPCKYSDGIFIKDDFNWNEIYPNAERAVLMERVYVAAPAFFVPESEYTHVFRFALYEVTRNYEDEADRNREPRVITVEIPVTVEKIED